MSRWASTSSSCHFLLKDMTGNITKLDLMTLIGLLTSKAQVSEPNRNVDIFTEQILFARMNTGEQMAGLHLCPSESTHTQTKSAQTYTWLSILASIPPQAHHCLPVSLSAWSWLTLQRENKGQTWWDEKRRSGLTWKAIKPAFGWGRLLRGTLNGHWNYVLTLYCMKKCIMTVFSCKICGVTAMTSAL